MRRVDFPLALLFVLAPVAAVSQVEVDWQYSIPESPEAQRQKEQERLAEQKIREEATRREQQEVDAELSRRGWPKSREAEVRKFIQLQKESAALKPKPGAGSLLLESTKAQDEWAQRREEAASSGSSSNKNSSANGQSEEARLTTGKKSNCWIEDKPSRVAIGYSETSEADARSLALSRTHDCKLVSEMFCDPGRKADFSSGTPKRGAKYWDCRVSYQCGETQKRCQNEPSAGSAQ